jgi:hypothetical protein
VINETNKLPSFIDRLRHGPNEKGTPCISIAGLRVRSRKEPFCTKISLCLYKMVLIRVLGNGSWVSTKKP